MGEKKKIVFFGSDDFAACHLTKLLETDHDVVAIVTQPDRPKGRGYKDISSPIKDIAAEKKITLLQPETLNDDNFLDILINFKVDLFIVIAYGQFLPAKILEIPRICPINVHGSLLPKYRGAAPINWSIIKGDTKTGVSIIEMNTKMDAGRIISSQEMDIDPNETSFELRKRMMKKGADLLIKTVDHIDVILEKSIKQEMKEVTFAPKLTKQLGEINWKKSAQEIHNLVRGLLPWPGAYTLYKDKRLKILETEIMAIDKNSASVGEVVDVNAKGLVVKTADQGILIKLVHLEASKKMDAASFIRGHQLKNGYIFK